MAKNPKSGTQLQLEDMASNEAMYLIFAAMKITNEIEEYFIAFALLHGGESAAGTTNPLVLVRPEGYEEFSTVARISWQMMKWNHKPEFLKKLERAYTETHLDYRHGRHSNKSWFFDQLAQAYLKWARTEYSKRQTG